MFFIQTFSQLPTTQHKLWNHFSFFSLFDWNSICYYMWKTLICFNDWVKILFLFHHVRLLFNEVYGGVQWRKKRSLKDLSNWNLFVVDSPNGFVRAHILFKQRYFYFLQIKNSTNILTGNCVHTKQNPTFLFLCCYNGFVWLFKFLW